MNKYFVIDIKDVSDKVISGELQRLYPEVESLTPKLFRKFRLDNETVDDVLDKINECGLKSLDKVMIRRGLFHSTKALSENGAFIFEIETPVDKQDLVRLNDLYGRESKPYEDSTFEESKSEYKLNNAEKLSVEIGISQIANGEFVTNEALARDTELWLKK